MESYLEELKLKKDVNRDDISKLLTMIGNPGEKRQEKMDAVKQLNLANFQGVQLEQSLESYWTY